MNVHDSERIVRLLKPLNYHATTAIEKADVIIVNTCTIREKAEQKAFSFLGRLADLKKRRPRLIVGIGGCVAQQEGARILERMPHIDLVFGTHAIGRLPGMIERIASKRCRVVDVEMSTRIEATDPIRESHGTGSPSRFVTIMRGCDNYCTYCVVPYVRGRESSRPPEHIVSEIRGLVENGVREVTLLGQNVNSYGKKEGLCSFPELLSQVNDIPGLLRIRFTTSHPKDLSGELIQAFGTLEKLCNHIHLPVQSGSNRILKRMNRKYTREQYLDKIDKLRYACPDIAVTTDIIAGFPGEDARAFHRTLDLIDRIGFDGLFAFVYSDRPNAPATRFADKIPEQEKKARLQAVLATQEPFTLRKNRALVGTIQQVLVEGLSKKQGGGRAENHPDGNPEGIRWTGRTRTNKIVNFTLSDDDDGHESGIIIGRMMDIRIERALSHSLWGNPVDTRTASPGLKGEDSFAA